MADTAQLWQAYITTRGKEAKDALVQAYLPFVRSIAGGVIRKLRPGVELDDLVSDGVFGLMRAVNTFDPARGFKFETYATPAVRGAIYNGLRVMDWVPERTRGKARALHKAMEQFSIVHGRPATEAELAVELKTSATEVYELIANLGAVYLLSLDQPLGHSMEDDDGTLLDTLADQTGPNPTLEAEFQEQRAIMANAVEHLNEREQVLVRMHYYDGTSFEEVARRLGVSKQRVSQMHYRVLQKLRESLGTLAASDQAAKHLSS